MGSPESELMFARQVLEVEMQRRALAEVQPQRWVYGDDRAVFVVAVALRVLPQGVETQGEVLVGQGAAGVEGGAVGGEAP